MENKNNHLKRILLVLISALLIFSSVFSGCSESSVAVSGHSSGSSSSESLSDLNYVSLNEGFTDVVVKDEKSALEAIASVADTLGIKNVDKELKICDVNTVDGDSYYRFQQYYNDIPVYGKTVVIAADENGNATDLTSNIISVSNDVELKPTATQSEIESSINKYAKKYFVDSSNITIPNLNECDLLIYFFYDETPYLVYQIYLGNYIIIIDANTSDVLTCFQNIVESDSTVCFNSNGTEKFNGYYNASESKYEAYDSERNIKIYTYKKADSNNDNTKYEYVTSDDEYFGNTAYEKTEEYNLAVNYMNNISKIYDYYSNGFSEVAYGSLVACYNDGYYNGDNALGGTLDGTNGYLSMGYKTGIKAIDTMAHEYTHVVTRHKVNWVSIAPWIETKDYPGAINEAYSDIFGEIIESKVKNVQPDWEHDDRIIHNPMSKNYPANINDKKYEKFTGSDGNEKWGMKITSSSFTDYSHGFSTVISHAAYLMWNGIDGNQSKKIDTNTLAKIWYKALNLMQSNATFNQCADNVYRSAKRLKGVTKDQLSCIEEAFSKVGIEVNVDACDIIRVHNDSVINVFDTNSKEYGNYHLKIVDIPFYQNNSQKSSIVIDEDVDNSYGYQLTLNDGSYKITVTDNDTNGSQKEFSQIINVIGKYSKKQTQLEVVNVNIYTDFGHTELSDFTIPKDMTLTLGELDSIEPETVPADATGYSIKWTSSDESVATVTPTGEECIITSKSKGTTTITGELVSNGKTITKSTNVRVASQGRDTVLVLDVSGSMSGTPIDEMKKSAINFCNELLADEYNNRVGLVLYDDYIASVDLTNDLDSLINNIENITSGGTTNMQGALAAAGNMLDSQGKDDNIKNVVIMADGLPNEGETSDTGKMSQLTQYSSYPSDVAYANGVINTAENIMSNYNMYSLGFFHDLSGVEKDFAIDLMKFLTNMSDGYHQVDTAENLQFAFGDIQETISDGSKVVINIACPVDVSVTYNGETLSSAQSTYSDTASFGTLQLLGKNKDIKVLSLDPSAVYDIQLNGTGSGTMNYSVNYLDDSDAIIDYRTFESIPITSTTKIDSNTNNSAGEITLNLDENGDGTVDKIYSAAVNSVAELTYGAEPQEPEVIEESEPVKSDDTWVTVMIAVVVVIALVGIILTVVLVSSSNKKKNPSYNIPVIEPKNNTVNKGGKITVISGSMSGKEFNLDIGKGYIIGKDSSKSQIVLAYDYGKVSREHCVISYDDQTQLYSVIDMSSNGTYYIDNKTAPLNSSVSKHRLNKNVGVELQSGCVLILGDEDCRVVLN